MSQNTQKYTYLQQILIMVVPYIIVFITTNPLYELTSNALPTQHELIKLLIVDIIHTIIVFAFSVVFNNSSIYDPYWNTATFAYTILLNSLAKSYTYTLRNIVIILPLLTYCVKQNYFYFRIWPGFSYEDFRYKQFIEMIKNPILYWCFSFLSFHLFPTFMVYFGIAPFYYTLNEDIAQQNIAQTLIIYLGSFISMAGVILEGVADYQLQNWKMAKAAQKKNNNNNKKSNNASDGEDYIDIGVWRYSRHPNYFGQMSLWWGIFIPILAITSYETPYWTIAGALAITALFNFYSIPAMESHLLKHRPSYQKYKNTVSRCIPWFRSHDKKNL